MGTRSAIAACAICAVSLVYAQPQAGIRPRPAPADYAVSKQSQNATYAASAVPPDQVQRMFATDISKDYLVFEVACYPGNSGSVKLAPGDFRIRSPKGDFIQPADAFTVAAVIQDERAPRPPSARDTNVITSANVGYESGTDPYTGQRVHSVYTGAGVAVEHGPDPGLIGPPPRGSTPYDRRVLETQLGDRALPQGNFTGPVAGFLYFPAHRAKKKSGGYTLEYLGDNSGSVQLEVPAKKR